MKLFNSHTSILSVATALVAVLFSGQAFTQQKPGQQVPDATLPDLVVSPPANVTKGNTPKPKPAQQAILDLFDKYEVVGMSQAHGNKDLDDFILALIRNPELPNKVNDIAVECGNSLYQPILDRYIAGEDVPITEVRPVWRNTTQNGTFGLSSFCEALFPLVRQVNKTLPVGKKLRVLAGDPPIDWSNIKSRKDFRQYGGGDRNMSIATIMEKEVLSKHRKALLLYGLFHLFHGLQYSAVAEYEKTYPNVTYIIAHYGGFGRDVPSAAKYKNELEKRMVGWPNPSLVTLKGTWLAEMDFAYFFPPLLMRQPSGDMRPAFPKGASSISKAADGFLYLGPSDLLLEEDGSGTAYDDKDYMAELRRRDAILYGGS